MRKLSLVLAAMALAAMAVGCATSNNGVAASSATAAKSIDYHALVNKLHPLPDDWEAALETVHITNSLGDDVEVEKKAYEAYRGLKADLEKEGVFVDLDSARRSVADQQRIMDEFTEQYGAAYAKKTVAQPGYSEHQTGLALDLYLIIDGKDITENEDMVEYPQVWEKIHAKLAEHGFILRYLEGAEHLTGYGYEPWHIRYIDDVETATMIASQGITFEEYLGAAQSTTVLYDYGTSNLYTRAELENAAIQVKCEFATFDGCELHSVRYAGDQSNTKENLERLNGMDQKAAYTYVCEFLTDFHSPAEGGGAWEADTEMKDYRWWLAREDEGDWELVSFGY